MFYNARTLGFLMACDEDDKKDEEIWDGDVLLPYQFDDFDDDPYEDLKDLLSKNIQINPSLPSCSGPATAYISVRPVIDQEVTVKNSDSVQEGKQSSEMVDEVGSEHDRPPDIGNLCTSDTSDTLASIVESLGISETVELGGVASDLHITEAEVEAEGEAKGEAEGEAEGETEGEAVVEAEVDAEVDAEQVIVNKIDDITNELAEEEEAVTTESQQNENIPLEAVTTEDQQCENIPPEGCAVSLQEEVISDDDTDRELAGDSVKLLDYRSICENIILVHKSDFLTLMPNVYVSDPIVNFYLDYVHRKLAPSLQKDVYIFPSWFYQVLSTTGTVMKPPVNIFDKERCKI